ncbi:DUF6907 domain-containing protein [Streptomyces sp. 2A115]|uniref:DUF6907 domain-containing protein n=1 Tax=Streptomyces sp. 2A115 TaxID=3457439 RepID=UPI003FD319E8
MRYDDLPVYGPTQILPDEGITPDVVVRVAYALSREQLATALGIGWAQMGEGRDPASLTVAEIREEVEGILGAAPVAEIDNVMERDRRRTWSAKHQAVMDQLAAAVDRAYPPTRPEPAVQDPRYAEGTVILQTGDHGEVTVPEPAWCTGHDGELVGYLADITHNGVHVKASASTWNHGLVEVMDAYISHAPYGELHDEPHPLLALTLDAHLDATPEDARKIAQALRVASLRIDRAADEADRLRGGAQ